MFYDNLALQHHIHKSAALDAHIWSAGQQN
jgi:hypothetical protein